MMTGLTRRAIPWLLLCLTLLGTTPAQAANRKSGKHYGAGTKAYVQGRYDEAIRQFEAGYEEDPRPEFLYDIAQAHRRAGRLDRAIYYLTLYLEAEPGAQDRAEVEKQIAGIKQEIDGKPAPNLAPVSALRTPMTAPLWRRWPLWVGVAAGVVVAGIVVTVAVVETRPKDPVLPVEVLP